MCECSHSEDVLTVSTFSHTVSFTSPQGPSQARFFEARAFRGAGFSVRRAQRKRQGDLGSPELLPRQFRPGILVLECEPIIDILDLEVVELHSRILTQPPPPPDPRTQTSHPNKYNKLEIKYITIFLLLLNSFYDFLN